MNDLTEGGGAPRGYLSFRLGAEEYGIDILRVQEIRRYDRPTSLPNAPEFIKGVINLRGVIVPLVDLRIKFGFSDVQYDGITATIVLNIGSRVVGVVVDSVSDVIELSDAAVKRPPEFQGAFEGEYLLGLGTITTGELERMLILLDIEKLMASPEMALISADEA